MNPFDKLFEAQRRTAAGQADVAALIRSVTQWVESAIPPEMRGTFDLASDPWRTNVSHHVKLGRQPSVLTGVVVYSVPMMGWYRVQLDELNTDLPCCRLLQQPGGKDSVGQDSQIPPGSPVLVQILPGSPYGIILGVVPLPVVSGSGQTADWIVQGGGGGFHRTRYYRDLLTSFHREGGLKHFSTGAPADQLCLGEWGVHGPLGVAAHVGNFMAYIRASEVCGLFANWLDNHLRLAGYNLDVQTAGSLTSVRNDEGEVRIFSGSTPFPWEACGRFEADDRATRENDAREAQTQLNESPLEPKDADVLPFWRHRTYGGYLGQGFRRELVIPSSSAQGANRASDAIHHPAVFVEQLGLDGSWAVASARSISIVKRGMLPVAIQLREPEDPKGDGAEDYRAAGQYGSGPTHRVSSPDFPGEDGNLGEVAGLADLQAHLFNWQGVHPFQYHQKDWKVPEPSEDPDFQRLVLASAFGELKRRSFISAQPSVELPVDHRYGETPYYQTTAGVYMLPQGGLVLRGSFGEEIALIGGNILTNCPGDVIHSPGRSFITLAGDDIVLRAKSSVDVSATSKDVRMKAKGNFEMLAGAGGAPGRFLIENQTAKDEHKHKDRVGEDIEGSGIIFKAANSKLISWTAGVYMRTGGGEITPGDIVLDAAKGERDIRTVSREFTRHIQFRASDAFPQNETKTIVNTHDASGNWFDAAIRARGGAHVTDGGLTVRGNVSIMGGHVGSEKASDFGFQVGWLSPGTQAHADVSKSLSEVEAILEQLRKQMGEGYRTTIKETFYDDERIGNDEFQKQVTFSWRNEKQYGTENGFKLMEPWWQLLARKAGAGGAGWTEESVKCGGKTLMPWPGNERWTQDTMLQYNLQLFDAGSGREKDRSSGLYEGFQPSAMTPTPPQGQYQVTTPE